MKTGNPAATRAANGRARRSHMARAAQAQVGELRRDPIELLERNSQGRVERLLPLRYGRMLASPFTFFRGSAILQAHDLSKTPNTGMVMPICGDAHLMNFRYGSGINLTEFEATSSRSRGSAGRARPRTERGRGGEIFLVVALK